MSLLMTCGLGAEGAYAAIIPFSARPYNMTFNYDWQAIDFSYSDMNLDFKVETPVIEFEIDVIRIEECSFPK